MNKPDDDPKARAALFQKREIRRTRYQNDWWFAITDIIAALTDSADPSDYWKKMRKRDPDLGKALQGGGQFVPPLPLEFATAGGLQKIQCWNTEGVFRLIQSIPSPKAESFKRWFARVGKERIGEIENPELGMGRMQKLYENERPIMQGSFGVNVDAYKKGTALERKNLRNHMTDLELILTMLDAATTAYFKQLTAKRPKKLKARED